MNAPDRELAETLFEDGIDSAEMARQLFAHGLLREQAELNRPDAAMRREARVHDMMQRLHEPAPSPTLSAPRSRSTSNRRTLRFAASAAALLLAFLAIFWLTADRSSALPELLAMARENQSRGLHIYRGSIESPHGTYEFDLALGEGGKVQIHYETRRGNFDFGINGKAGWFRTPIGKAVEVPLWDLPPLLDSLPGSFKTLGPNLSYLEVEGLLTKILTKEGMRITGYEEAAEGKELVALEGRYKVLGREPHWHRSRRKGPCRDETQRPKTWCGQPTVFKGSVKVRISPEKGWIHDIRFKDAQRQTETYLERVLSLPDLGKDARPAWIEFEPVTTRTPASVRLLRFLGAVLRRAKESKHARDQGQKQIQNRSR
jgi:hypothetical protein